MDWFQERTGDQRGGNEIAEKGADQDEETGETEARPSKQAPEDEEWRTARQGPDLQVIGQVQASQIFWTAQMAQYVVYRSGRQISTRSCLFDNVAPQFLDDVACLFTGKTPESGTQVLQVFIDLLLRPLRWVDFGHQRPSFRSDASRSGASTPSRLAEKVDQNSAICRARRRPLAVSL